MLTSQQGLSECHDDNNGNREDTNESDQDSTQHIVYHQNEHNSLKVAILIPGDRKPDSLLCFLLSDTAKGSVVLVQKRADCAAPLGNRNLPLLGTCISEASRLLCFPTVGPRFQIIIAL